MKNRMERKSMVKLKRIILLFAILLALIGILFHLKNKPSSNKKELCTIIVDQSYFDDFEVIDNKVLIYCEICIQNNTNLNQEFFLKADFKEDKQCRLLKDRYLYACNDSNEKQLFYIGAKDTVYLNVTFVGEFGGNRRKANRLFPQIDVLYKK